MARLMKPKKKVHGTTSVPGKFGRTSGKSSGKVKRPKRPPRFAIPKDAKIDYKNIAFLQKFVTDRGKIASRRMTGATAKQQRALGLAVKRSKFLGLLITGSVKRK